MHVRLTLASLQSEMRASFASMSERIHKLDVNVNQRIDNVLLGLDEHIKETRANFRGIDQRFDQIDQRLSQMSDAFGELVATLSPYFAKQEEKVGDHERRISELEKRSH